MTRLNQIQKDYETGIALAEREHQKKLAALEKIKNDYLDVKFNELDLLVGNTLKIGTDLYIFHSKERKENGQKRLWLMKIFTNKGMVNKTSVDWFEFEDSARQGITKMSVEEFQKSLDK